MVCSMSYSPKLTPWRCYPGSSSKHVEFQDSDLTHAYNAAWPVTGPGPDFQTITVATHRRGGNLYYFGQLSFITYFTLARIGLNTDQSLNASIRGTQSGAYDYGDDKFYGVTSTSIGLETRNYLSSAAPRGGWNESHNANILIFTE